MKINSFISRNLVAVRLFLASVLLALGASSWAALDPQTQQQVQALSDYLPAGNYADIILSKFEIPEPVGMRLKDMPFIAQVEYGYAAAERGHAGSGKDFVAMLVHDVGDRNEAAHHEPVLAPVLGASAPDVKLDFIRGPPFEHADMPPDLQKQVIALSEYCAASPLGSIHAVFVHHLGLDSDTAYRILSSSVSQEQAFVSAFAALPSDEVRKEKISDLAHQIHRENVAIGFEPALRSILMDTPDPNPRPEFWRPKPDGAEGGDNLAGGSPLNSGGGGGGGGGGAPIWPQTRAAEPTVPNPISNEESLPRYSDFVKGNYESSSGSESPIGSSFRAMAASAEGFGGIVFGNRVSAAPSVLRPARISFQPVTNNWGNLRVDFADGSHAVLVGLTTEDVLAAHEIVFAPQPGIAPAEPAKGIGMVGIYGNMPFVLAESDGMLAGSQFNVILHPAFVNKALGWAFIRVDTMPIVRGSLRRMDTNALDLPAISAVEQLWDTLDREDSLGTWKTLDAPLVISIETNAVEPLITATSFPELETSCPLGLRRTAYLQMQHYLEAKTTDATFTGSTTPTTTVDQGFGEAFYELVPNLVQVSDDYAKVNNFARILAVFRWAKEQGAVFDSSSLPASPPRVYTPVAIQVSSRGVVAVSEITDTNAYIMQNLENVTNLLSQLTQKYPQLAGYEQQNAEIKEAALKLLTEDSSTNSDDSVVQGRIEELVKRQAELDKTVSNVPGWSDFNTLLKTKEELITFKQDSPLNE